MIIRKSLLILGIMMTFCTVTSIASNLKIAELSVQNMTCNLCPIIVRKALEKVPGVKKASVDLDTKIAKIAYDPEKTKVEDLIKATTKAGYPSLLIKRYDA